MTHNLSSRLFCGIGALAIMLAVLAAVRFAPAQARTPGAADPDIAALLAQVETSTLLGYANQLSGETPATVGGAPYIFTTRNSEEDTAITKATQFAYEFFEAHALTARYHTWTGASSPTGLRMQAARRAGYQPDLRRSRERRLVCTQASRFANRVTLVGDHRCTTGR